MYHSILIAQNGILLVSRLQVLHSENNLRKTIIEGALDRLNPILMTALTTGLALIPLALAGGQAGSEIQSPMAMVILGALITSTFLNLLVIPSNSECLFYDATWEKIIVFEFYFGKVQVGLQMIKQVEGIPNRVNGCSRNYYYKSFIRKFLLTSFPYKIKYQSGKYEQSSNANKIQGERHFDYVS